MSEIEKRKRKTVVSAYNYNSICDIYGCSNMARVSLGVKEYGPGTKYNICNECLEDIVADAPISLVIDREDVQRYIDEVCKPYATEIALNMPIEFIMARPDIQAIIASRIETTVAEATELVEPVNAEFSLKPDIPSSKDDEEMNLIKAKSWNDLRAFAKELTIVGYGTMKRDEMEVAILEKLKEGDA